MCVSQTLFCILFGIGIGCGLAKANRSRSTHAPDEKKDPSSDPFDSIHDAVLNPLHAMMCHVLCAKATSSNGKVKEEIVKNAFFQVTGESSSCLFFCKGFLACQWPGEG